MYSPFYTAVPGKMSTDMPLTSLAHSGDGDHATPWPIMVMVTIPLPYSAASLQLLATPRQPRCPVPLLQPFINPL